MKKKSKFLVFILSPLPGLSHLYLGWTRRALVFFGVFLGLCVGAITMENISYQTSNMIGPLIFFVIALLWFIALAEAMSLAGRNIDLADDANEANHFNSEDKGLLFISDRKMIALAFSAIPGAGHMYLGLIKQGAQLMAGFFFILLLAGWLNLSLLGFVIPVIWFYSVFDIYHLLEDEEEVQLESSTIFDWFSTHPGWLGWGLIALGLLVIVQRIASPALAQLLSESMRSYIETTFVALILIAGGIVLLLGNKVKDSPKEPARQPARLVEEIINESANRAEPAKPVKEANIIEEPSPLVIEEERQADKEVLP
ncbi:MAG: hypothetical protein PHX14_10065 [Syntrophomonadaceae bacterium]|nr:hypothetical protein [Syntrophomonadaceae bacterium]